ncbi:YidB family protein [Neisseriaceae bacterium B1]
MGLFDTLLNTAVSSMAGGNNQQNIALQLVMQLIQQNGGNVGGLLNQLQQGGVGDALQSWIAQGGNQSVNGSDIENALGGSLEQAAQKVGVDNHEAGGLLAQYLPQIIDSITPSGQAQDADGFGLDDIARIAMQQLLK